MFSERFDRAQKPKPIRSELPLNSGLSPAPYSGVEIALGGSDRSRFFVQLAPMRTEFESGLIHQNYWLA
jgi:hypothetical protein